MCSFSAAPLPQEEHAVYVNAEDTVPPPSLAVCSLATFVLSWDESEGPKANAAGTLTL